MRGVLTLLIDTSTWLDLAKRRDGQRWIVALRAFEHQKRLRLLVPTLVVDEFTRNRQRIEASMTANVSERFKALRRDLDEYGGDEQDMAVELIRDLARHVPLIGAMTTRNFDDIATMLAAQGVVLEPSSDDEANVVRRGLEKRAPFHRDKNSSADALLIELYATAISAADLRANPHAFVTSNIKDFSVVSGDTREPHADIAAAFAAQGSSYRVGVDGLDAVLREHLSDELDELFAESDFVEEPRRLEEIIGAEREFFDRIWYHRSLMQQHQLEELAAQSELEGGAAQSQLAVLARLSAIPRRRIEEQYTEPGQLGPYSDFELGMLNGKLSAVRWVLGSEWDFLDT